MDTRELLEKLKKAKVICEMDRFYFLFFSIKTWYALSFVIEGQIYQEFMLVCSRMAFSHLGNFKWKSLSVAMPFY